MDGGGYMPHPGGAPGMVLTPGGTQRSPQFPSNVAPQVGIRSLARMHDSIAPGDGPPEKRQRLYGPGQGYSQ
jgi:hypothetical protein